eukprot:9112338-Pyramimonas_sp.AAC.1
MDKIQDMMLGKPSPLLSTFHLNYYTLLNVMRRSEGVLSMQHVIENSFLQFQNSERVPIINADIERLKKESAAIVIPDEGAAQDCHRCPGREGAAQGLRDGCYGLHCRCYGLRCGSVRGGAAAVRDCDVDVRGCTVDVRGCTVDTKGDAMLWQEYAALVAEAAELEGQVLKTMLKPENCVHFLRAGRLVRSLFTLQTTLGHFRQLSVTF